MICENCIHFSGMFDECEIGVLVDSGLEATFCNEYTYNGNLDAKEGE